MRESQPIRSDLDVPEQEQIEIDRARPMARSTERAPVLGLDRLAEVEELIGLERSPYPYGGIEKVGLVEELAHRLGLIQRGNRLDVHPAFPQILDRAAQVGFAIADVRSEPDVADSLRILSGAQTPSSSSDSRSSERSTVTSTPASWTG
jgi:hypothetical protein